MILIKVPSLRERPDDIRPLIEHFIKTLSRSNHKRIESIDEEIFKCLESYSWPGNVRELRNVIERIVVLSQSPRLTVNQLPEDLRTAPAGSANEALTKGNSWNLQSSDLQGMEKELIRVKLIEAGGNKSEAARKLGISRRTLYRKIDEYGL